MGLLIKTKIFLFQGFTTYLFTTNIEMRTMSYVWRALEKQLPEEIKEKIMRMRFCKDRKVTFVTNTEKIQELLMCRMCLNLP
jgi:hypothetical protein